MSITKDLAKKLNYPINTPEFRDALNAYAEFRMDQIKTSLTTASDAREIAVLQGRYKEASDLKYLKEQVQDVKDKS